MNFKEKKLYHQIHPVKIVTDWITGAISLYLLWYHLIAEALIVMFIPSIVVSIVIIKYVRLEKHKKSSFGNYIRVSMSKSMEIVRFAGFAIAITGAWHHSVWLIICGLIVILL